MKTLDSILEIAKSVSATVGSTVTGLLASGVIPVPDSWKGAATAAAAALTGFSVWLTSNKDTIEADANKAVAALDSADPALAPLLEWAVSPDTTPAT